MSPITKTKDHPKDVCECGDYRRQHDDTGRCVICAFGKQIFDRCLKFVLARRYDFNEQ